MNFKHPLSIGLLCLCFSSFSQICDDFTSEPWPSEATYGPTDTVGFTQDGSQPIIVGDASSADFYGTEDVPGIYVIENSIKFEFDNTYQTASFERYGWTGDGTEEGFSVNGSDTIYFDSDFPVTIDGITISMEDSPSDFGFWDINFVHFTGNLESINFIGVEFGITELCVEHFTPLGDNCDDFTDEDDFPYGHYTAMDTVGFTQDSGFPIRLTGEWLGADYGAGVNTEFPEGIYIVGGSILFELDGSDQTVTIESYSWIGAGIEEGLIVNESDTIFLGETFPLEVDGITIDLDMSAPAYDSWDTYYLTFSGELDQIILGGIEYGVKNFCIESDAGIGIDAEEKLDLQLYPNPASDFITIEAGQELTTVKIYNLAGKLIYHEEKIAKNKLKINTGQFEQGLYFIQIEYKEGTAKTTKFVKN